MKTIFRVIILPLLIILLIIAIGTIGYMSLSGLPFIDALHLVIVTLSTCGLRQPTMLSFEAQLFDIIFIIIGFLVMISVFSKTLSLILEGQIRGIREKEEIKKALKKLKDHYIVCGFGRVGSHVAARLKASKIPVVVIDSNPAAEERMKALQVPYVIGNLSSDETLKKANIQTAKGLVACADSDVENVFVTLSAKTINPAIQITARASDPANEEKLRRAGASHIVSPYITTGQKISGIILNPSIAEFLDRVMHDSSLELWFQEIKVGKNSHLVGKSLKELDIRGKSGVIVIAIKRANNSFELSPEANTKINSDDVLICLGSNEQIAKLKTLL